MLKLYEYAACSTCKKARSWLMQQNIAFQSIGIVQCPPSIDELGELVRRSGVPVRKWFNTSGQSYRTLIATRGRPALQALDDNAILELLAKDGKLIKRPILVTPTTVLIGFQSDAYTKALSQ